MSVARVSSRGQVVVSGQLTRAANLRPGDHVAVQIQADGSILLRPQRREAMSLAGMVKTRAPVSLEDMERAIEDGALGR